MTKWIWLAGAVILVVLGVAGYLLFAGSGIDAVTSASIRIITPGEKDIQQTRVLHQAGGTAWIDISDIVFRKEWTEYGGPRVAIEYDLNEPDITPDTP
ncbi:MAG TPA: hypothetical protein VKA68_06660, partial [bacterium]|nr:hypothetical protein [bacterium]